MKPIHIFTTGTHTDSHGTAINFSDSDLAGAIGCYDPKLHEAPIVVGHPKTEDPAYGWVQSLSANGGNLYATPQQVNPEFAEQVEAGAYKKVSASFYPPNSPSNPVQGKYYLRHVGFLGAQPPAIKGMKPIEFGEADDCVTLEMSLDFSEQPTEKQTSFMESMKTMWTLMFGEGDDPLPSPPQKVEGTKATEQVDSDTQATQTPSNTPLKKAEDLKANQSDNQPNEPENKDDDMASTPQPTQAELDAKQAEVDKLKKQIDDKDKAEATAKAEKQVTENTDFAEALVTDGKLAPKDKEIVSAILNGLDIADGVAPVEFGEGDDKKPLKQAVKDKLSNANTETFAYLFSESASKRKNDPDHVDYAEGTDPDRAELDQKIRAYAKENELEYSEATHIVMSS